MAFPQTPLPIKQEMLIGGTWTDITSRTRADGQVVITRGYSGEQSNLSAGTCAFTLNNRDYAFSNNNPTSANYGLLGRNTPYRTGVDTGVVSARFLDAQGTGTTTYDGSTVWCADSAALDIVGDIDVAVDVDFHDLVGRRGHFLASKYVGGGSNQRSWVFFTNGTQQLEFVWSTDGTSANRIFATCPVQINPTGRAQYRVQLDVNNGSGGWTCSFYVGTGTDVSGPYSLLGSTSGTGVTSIFASTSRVECGTFTNAASWPGLVNPDADPFVGRYYAMVLRNGLNGTVVAQMRADQQTAGTTSWADGLGNTWTVTGSSFLSSTDYRFWGEVPSLPNRSDVSGKNIYIPVTANDVIGRLTSGSFSKPLNSPVFRNLSRFAWDGYWPMEQASGSTSMNANNGRAGTFTLSDFSPDPTGFDGSAGAFVANDDNAYASAFATSSTGTPTLATYMLYFKLGALPGSASYAPLIEFFPQAGSAFRITLYANNSTYRMIIIDQFGAALADITPGTFGGTNSPTNWTAMRVKLSSSGGTVTAEWAWYQINSPTIYGNSATYSGTVGRPQFWRMEAWTGKIGMQVAHIAMGRLDVDFTGLNFINSTNAYIGESWANRARRLAAEQNFPIFLEGPWPGLNGDLSFVHQMGIQGRKTLMDLFRECAVVAGGDIFAPRNKYGLTIRMWEQAINQSGPQLNYANGYLSGKVEPEPDTFLIENDVTLTNPGGASFRYPKTTGSLNTGDPSTGAANAVGTYDVSDAINLYSATDLETYVRRRVMFGTWDEPRWPQIQIQLERALFVADAVLTAYCRKVDLLRPFTITNLTPNLSYNNVDLMVVGYQETLGAFTNTIRWNTRPGGPWKTGVWGSATIATPSRWGAASTVLKTGVNTTATSLTFETTDVFETWSTTATGYPVEISGERMTISSVGARSGTGPYDYAVTVVRSVNGVIKSLPANAPVTVVNTGRWT